MPDKQLLPEDNTRVLIHDIHDNIFFAHYNNAMYVIEGDKDHRPAKDIITWITVTDLRKLLNYRTALISLLP